MFSNIIVKIIEEKLSQKIHDIDTSFLEEGEVELIDYLKEYVQDYGELPTKERLQKANPEWFMYTNEKTLPEPVLDQIDTLHEQRWELMLEEAWAEARMTRPIDTSIIEKVMKLKPNGRKGKLLRNVASLDRKNLYLNTPSDSVPFGIKMVDRATGGIITSDYILMGGHSGSGKSTFLSYLAVRLALGGHRVLIINKEMSDKQMIQKIDAALVGLDSKVFRRGSDEDREVIEDNLSDIEKSYKLMKGELMIAESHRISSVRDIKNIATQYERETGFPFDWILVDGLYIFADSYAWSDVKLMSSQLRQIAKTLNTRIFATTQFKQSISGKMHYSLQDFAYSTGMTEDATLVLAWYDNLAMPVKDGLKVKHISILKNREGEVETAGTAQIYLDFKTSSMYDAEELHDTAAADPFSYKNLLMQPINKVEMKEEQDEALSP